MKNLFLIFLTTLMVGCNLSKDTLDFEPLAPIPLIEKENK